MPERVVNMNGKKLADAVANYERTRQQVAKLTDQRAKLNAICSNENVRLSPPYECIRFCLGVAAEDLKTLLKDNFPDTYTYEEVLEENHANGTCCQNCYDSYEIKTGPLAKARTEFGHAKRTLSRFGKTLMKKKPL